MPAATRPRPGRPALSPAAAIVIALITVYRHTLALFLGGRCRFHPSCSVYGQQAVARFGALRGLWLTTQRVCRCHPWHPGGVDCVPASVPDAVIIDTVDDAAKPRLPRNLTPGIAQGTRR